MADMEVTVSYVGMKTFDGMNQNFTAIICPITENVNNGKTSILGVMDEPRVVCILEDAEFSLDNQYSTPFESSNPEGRMPNLMGMIQSGQIMASTYDIMQAVSPPSLDSVIPDGMGKALFEKGKAKVSDFATELEGLKGKSSFTKINSQQIYTSSNSIKISATAIFSAWADAKEEVEKAIQKLQEWATPILLSDKSIITSIAEEQSLTGLFPSTAPPLVKLTYAGKEYLPLVIESLSAPMVAPMNENGDRITVKCQITFASLKAWDKNNIIQLYGGTPTV